ncbi:hypothetical protein SBOR_0184 [Sclerotinia borealis F-4128]|uniref:LPXTG-domain-containing protein n=1 Tax=Sclerotinia borealis (strain F-4128) TaxID=1432307 RepID=W9CRL1_SCLBF|nr:hypothetical protein SBOR_0184 [Sclerotinia borealis F-4128]
MARFRVLFGLFSLVTHMALALMVTPDSPCMSLCSDGQNSDNIDGSEIVCQNSDFITTTAGQKLKSCLSCLQLSTAAGNGQNDQHCFMYNIRYTLASCLYGFSNATDTIATPCSTSKACGPLQLAIEDGNFITSNETDYGYCSANYNSILSSGTTACKSCLRSGDTESYLSNFLTALQGGCHQQPPDGTIIGLNASVFSQHSITETSPGQSYNTTVPSTTHSKGLSKDSIIGISVGLGILLLITLFIIYTLWRKSISLNRRRVRHSSLDERYGALNITAPNEGAFGNPQTRFKTISLAAPQPAKIHNNTNTTQPFNLSKYPSDDESLHKRDTIIFPAHQAYYPASHPRPHLYPHSKAEDTVPIMLNDESPSPYTHHSSSNEQTPTSNPTRTFSPPTHNLARMPSRSENASFYNPVVRDRDRDRDIDRNVDMSRERDITTSYARAAIDGTQHSGISATSSSSSPNARNIQTQADNGEIVNRTKSPRVDIGDERGMRERERGREKERGKKKKKGNKRMTVINDQDQDEDQWPGEF